MGSGGHSIPFGRVMREHFLLAPSYVNLNHGSYGVVPRQVRDQLRHYQDLCEASPDAYMRYISPGLLEASRAAAASILRVPVDELVFIQNATNGINIVLRNLVYQPQDAIIYFDTVYGAIEKTVESIVETNPGLQSCKVDYVLPCLPEEIVSNFRAVVREARAKGLNPKVAIFDTIVSLPGVRFPFERMTEECRKENILSCIDGAHGIGQIPLDLGNLDADFFTTNCHKWFFTPRACALLHIPLRNHDLIRTNYPTSHGYLPLPRPENAHIRNPLPPDGKTSAFASLFQYTATLDNAPYYCFPAADAFRQEVCGGEEVIMKYIQQVVREGSDIMAKVLETEVMDEHEGKIVPGGLRDCAMATVRLPITVAASDTTSSNCTEPEIQVIRAWMERKILGESGTFVPVFGYKGNVWCRVSGQVYLEVGDFEWVGAVLRGLCERVRSGEWR